MGIMCQQIYLRTIIQTVKYFRTILQHITLQQFYLQHHVAIKQICVNFAKFYVL